MHLDMSYYQAVRGMTELGVTVALGCLTTFMAGVILLTGTLYFFQQFGTFLSLLMAFSFSYAMLLLMPLLASIGWVDRILAHKFTVWMEGVRGQTLEEEEVVNGTELTETTTAAPE